MSEDRYCGSEPFELRLEEEMKKWNENDYTELYEQEEIDALEAHISRSFGEFSSVFHEIYSPDIHLDICIIPPSARRNYYILTTMGMGAHRMDVPPELAEFDLERAELMICLPPDWNISSREEKWHWPIRLLKSTARLPIEEKSWLGWGHTVSSGSNLVPYAENTLFCGVMLLRAGSFGKRSFICKLPSGSSVNFYLLLPLYREEIDFKLEYGADALFDLFPQKFIDVVNVRRPNVVTERAVFPQKSVSDFYMDENDALRLPVDARTGFEPDDEDWEEEMTAALLDCALAHIEVIHEKKLPVDEIAAYNHLAIYLRWCIEHELMNEVFLERYPDIVSEVKAGAGPDLRVFLRDSQELCQSLFLFYFNEPGSEFSWWYYGECDDETHFFPYDIEEHARKFFGEQRYESEEFQGEAYLFVPWNEAYYEEMSAVMDAQFTRWQRSFTGECEEPEPYDGLPSAFAWNGFESLIESWEGMDKSTKSFSLKKRLH